MKKKVLAGLLTMAFVIAGFAVMAPLGDADAATVKGLAAKFLIINDEQADYDYHMRTWNTMGKKEIADLSKVTISYTAYVPYAALKKAVGDDKGMGINMDFAIFIPWPDVKAGADQYLYYPQFKNPNMHLNEDGIIECWWHNQATEQGEEAPWASVSKAGDFVKVSVTDAGIDFNRTAWSEHYASSGDLVSEGEMAVSDIPGGTYDFDIMSRIDGWGFNANGEYMIADVVVKYDGNNLFKANYNTKDDIGNYDYRDVNGKQRDGNLKATTLNPTFKVAKTKLTVKAKKSATVKVTPHFAGEKVTVKSSSAKVAKASYKSGKVTVKGVKKGKAVISVTCNGTTKKINVTVK